MTNEVPEVLENLEDEVLANIAEDDVTPVVTETEKAPVEESTETEKTREELLSMNLEAQQQISRQGNEIGELRKLTDEILRKQLESTATVEEDDWTLPDGTEPSDDEKIQRKRVDAIEQRLELGERQIAHKEFVKKHSDYLEVAQDAEFREWVISSSIRSRMFAAGNAGDYELADELLTEWGSMRPDESEDSGAAETEKALEDAKMLKGGGKPTGKPVFLREDIRNMRINNPRAYEKQAEIISLAYKEGRVW